MSDDVNMDPYLHLCAAKIDRAVKDLRHKHEWERHLAWQWLMHDEDCEEFCEALGMDVDVLREEVRERCNDSRSS